MSYNRCFDLITEESAYWIGFIVADGSICETTQNRKIIEVTLSSVDKNHLQKYNFFLGRKRPVYDFTKKTKYGIVNASRVSFNSPHCVEVLKEYGITNNKSLGCKVVDKLAFNRHFWRGVIDGDGCIYFDKCNRPTLELIGSYDLLSQYKKFLKSKSSASLRKKTNSRIWKYSVSGKFAIDAIKIIYSDSNIFLDRKFKKINNL